MSQAQEHQGIDWIETGMPGIKRHPETLVPVIVDEAAAQELLEGDDPCDAVVVLIARGELHRAADLVADVRLTDPQNTRMRLLDTDLQRALGNDERAIRRLRTLIDEFAGTRHEATMQQYLGILYYTAGDYTAARHRFERALALHTEAGASERRLELARRSLAAVDRREAALR